MRVHAALDQFLNDILQSKDPLLSTGIAVVLPCAERWSAARWLMTPGFAFYFVPAASSLATMFA